MILVATVFAQTIVFYTFSVFYTTFAMKKSNSKYTHKSRKNYKQKEQDLEERLFTAIKDNSLVNVKELVFLGKII